MFHLTSMNICIPVGVMRFVQLSLLVTMSIVYPILFLVEKVSPEYKILYKFCFLQDGRVSYYLTIYSKFLQVIQTLDNRHYFNELLKIQYNIHCTQIGRVKLVIKPYLKIISRKLIHNNNC